MSFPPASVIVCTRNRPGFARSIVASILGAEHVPDEIVVVDQSDVPDSDLGAMEPVGGCEIVHLPSHTRGLSAARNEGIATARHDLLIVVDDDMLAPPSWYSTLVGTLVARGSRAVVTGQVREGEPEVHGGFAPSLMTDERPAIYEGRVGRDILYPNNMALHRLAVDEVGPFDERLGPGTRRFPGGGEDNDFCYRLLEAGFIIVYEPAALLYHRAWRPETDFLRLRWEYGRGQGGFYGKHIGLGDRHVLWRLVRDSGSLCWRIVRDAPRRRRVAIGHAAFLAGLLSAAAEWNLTQREPRRRRRR